MVSSQCLVGISNPAAKESPAITSLLWYFGTLHNRVGSLVAGSEWSIPKTSASPMIGAADAGAAKTRMPSVAFFIMYCWGLGVVYK